MGEGRGGSRSLGGVAPVGGGVASEPAGAKACQDGQLLAWVVQQRLGAVRAHTHCNAEKTIMVPTPNFLVRYFFTIAYRLTGNIHSRC